MKLEPGFFGDALLRRHLQKENAYLRYTFEIVMLASLDYFKCAEDKPPHYEKGAPRFARRIANLMHPDAEIGDVAPK